jgi:putative PIN family toxin of toxin-antitoxin system
MRRAVLDSTVLVSAFLNPAGISAELLRQAEAGAFTVSLADEVLAETQRVLLDYPRIRKRYHYADEAVVEYVGLLGIVSHRVTSLPKIRAVIRDPNDDMILACAIKAKAAYVLSRDKDLLDLQTYGRVKIVSPEDFLTLLRKK